MCSRVIGIGIYRTIRACRIKDLGYSLVLKFSWLLSFRNQPSPFCTNCLQSIMQHVFPEHYITSKHLLQEKPLHLWSMYWRVPFVVQSSATDCFRFVWVIFVGAVIWIWNWIWIIHCFIHELLLASGISKNVVQKVLFLGMQPINRTLSERVE